ncbi:unnamed protein product, partial [Scytosiphon promiscuus]
ALAFYEGALGFRRVFENGDPVGFVVLRCDDAEFHLTLQPDRRPASFNVMHMMVGDVDAVHEACRRSGLRVIKGARDHEHGLRAFVFADPDGNRIDVTAPVSGKT